MLTQRCAREYEQLTATTHSPFVPKEKSASLTHRAENKSSALNRETLSSSSCAAPRICDVQFKP